MSSLTTTTTAGAITADQAKDEPSAISRFFHSRPRRQLPSSGP